MASRFEGGCQCGAIRYEVRAEPLTVYACHCSQCQKQSASAFSLTMMVPEDGFRVVLGSPHTFSRPAADGHAVTYSSCGTCCALVFHTTSRAPGIVGVTPGTLDDPGRVEPVAHFWTVRKLPWVAIPDGVLTYEEQPASMEAPMAAWRARRGQP